MPTHIIQYIREIFIFIKDNLAPTVLLPIIGSIIFSCIFGLNHLSAQEHNNPLHCYKKYLDLGDEAMNSTKFEYAEKCYLAAKQCEDCVDDKKQEINIKIEESLKAQITQLRNTQISLRREKDKVIKQKKISRLNLADFQTRFMSNIDANIAFKMASSAYELDSTSANSTIPLLKAIYRPSPSSASYYYLKKSQLNSKLSFICFSPNYDYISGWENIEGKKHLTIWETASGNKLFSFYKPEIPISSMTFYPEKDSILLVSYKDKKSFLFAWRFKEEGNLADSLFSVDGMIKAPTFYKHGKSIYYIQENKIVTRSESGMDSIAYSSQNVITAVNISPDEQFFITVDSDSNANIFALGQADSIVYSFKSYTNRKDLLEFCPSDTNIFISQDKKNRFALYNTEGKILNRFRSYYGQYKSFRFSNDGNNIVSASSDGTTKVWQQDGTLLSTLGGEGEALTYAAFCMQDKFVFTKDIKGSMKIWDVEKEKLIANLSSISTIKNFSFSPDGNYIISTHFDENIRIWPLQKLGHESINVARFEIPKSTGSIPITFSPDGKKILSGGPDGIVRIFSFETEGDIIEFPAHTESVTSLAYSPNRDVIVTAGKDYMLKLWNIDGDSIENLFELKSARVIEKLQFILNGRYILSKSYTDLNIWFANGSLVNESTYFGIGKGSQYAYEISDFDFSPTDFTLLTTTPWLDGTRRFNFTYGDLSQPLIDPNTGENKKFEYNQGPGGFSAYSPNGDRILVSGGGFDPSSSIKIYNSEGDSLYKYSVDIARIQNARFVPNNNFVICTYLGNNLSISNDEGNEIINFKPHKEAISDIAIDPNGHYFATVSAKEGLIKIWPLSPKALLKHVENLAIEEDLSTHEKITYLNYEDSDFLKSSDTTELLAAARYYAFQERGEEASALFKKFSRIAKNIDVLSPHEKYSYLNYYLYQFLRQKDPEIMLASARYFDKIGYQYDAGYLLRKSLEIGMETKRISVPEKLKYLSYKDSDFLKSENKDELLKDAQYFANKLKEISNKSAEDKQATNNNQKKIREQATNLYKRIEDLHGSSNWEGLTPAERHDYLNYNISTFATGNNNKKDLLKIFNHFKSKKDSASIDSAYKFLSLRSDGLLNNTRLSKDALLIAARYFVAKNESDEFGLMLFHMADSAHGARNWGEITPKERREYLKYSVFHFTENNTVLKDLIEIFMYFDSKTSGFSPEANYIYQEKLKALLKKGKITDESQIQIIERYKKYRGLKIFPVNTTQVSKVNNGNN